MGISSSQKAARSIEAYIIDFSIGIKNLTFSNDRVTGYQDEKT